MKKMICNTRRACPRSRVQPVVTAAAIICCVFGAFLGNAQQTTSLIPVDKGSKVCFSIRNFGIKTNGEFSGLDGKISFDPEQPAKTSMDVTVRSASVNTGNKTRDRHLRQNDYFNAEKFPAIRIQSSAVAATTTASQFLFTGVLSIKGISRPIKFKFTAVPAGDGMLFVSEKFRINRMDFDVGASSISLSDDVDITISVYARR